MPHLPGVGGESEAANGHCVVPLPRGSLGIRGWPGILAVRLWRGILVHSSSVSHLTTACRDAHT